ncbi:unnamed protein product, partial [Porites evermanni]
MQIIESEKEALKKDYKELKSRKRLIKLYKKITKAREKVRKGVDIKKEYKKKKKIKTFEEYFEECIKNKEIPKDTPDYLRRSLERAMYEHEQGIQIEKSALDNFAVKYVFEGIPGLSPIEYYNRVYSSLINLVKEHRNVKIKMVMVCLMERVKVKTDKGIKELEDIKAYFSSKTYKNYESSNEEEIVVDCMSKILEDIEEFTQNGSGWYFKEVLKLEVNTIKFNPIKGSSYINLPDWITNKKAIVNIQNKDEKCFLWCILRYLNPKETHEERIKDLEKYEFSLNTTGITFPMKLKDITKFETDDFHNTNHEFKKNVDLLTRKGVYPYDYVSSLDKLSETQLPPKEEFYSQLNDEDISDEDYQHAIKVWNTFGCKTMRDYHNLYLKSDVLLLADVFENFRKTCLKHYKLDPAHYYTSPGLAWDACLKETGQQLELIHDYDMLMMFERGIRGGITHISKRYAEANNKYMKDYNPDVESSYIQYLDANNLYGWAMTQQLPTHGFKWIKDITVEKVMDIFEKANHSMSNIGRKGYIFEVDLEYPPHLWETHNDYPLAPEKMIVNGVEKLICHFKPRKNYVVHYRTLRQCLELGMRITAVHRGISFYQSNWMEPYIRKNTELRKKATNNFEKDFFKLMNNSVFGKTIENIRKRQNIYLINNRKKALKLSSKPNFDRCTIFDRNLIAIHMLKTEVYFNKPVYVGQAILDLSKTLMFNFHYTYIKEKYGKKAELLFTDTDSLMYEIKTKDFYKDINPDILTKFDTSDYPLI